jgi:hypothetical protein
VERESFHSRHFNSFHYSIHYRIESRDQTRIAYALNSRHFVIGLSILLQASDRLCCRRCPAFRLDIPIYAELNNDYSRRDSIRRRKTINVVN